MTTTPNPNDWLHDAVLKGIKGLMALRLEGAPGEDTVGTTSQAWIAVLATMPHTWHEDRDRARITQAFLALARTCERWPAPAAFIRCLPAITPQVALTPPRSIAVPPAFKTLVAKLTGKSEVDTPIRDYGGEGPQP
jgi:hypothetical protein